MGGKFPSHIHPNFPPKSGISDPFPISRSLCISLYYQFYNIIISIHSRGTQSAIITHLFLRTKSIMHERKRFYFALTTCSSKISPIIQPTALLIQSIACYFYRSYETHFLEINFALHANSCSY
jgi:hypothetical protein